jgi:murein L,D-transpeptidase YafK
MSRRFCALAAAFAVYAAALPAADLTLPGARVETDFLHAVEALRAGRVARAQDLLADVVHEEPKFHLAQLLYAEVLAARSGDRSALAGIVPDSPKVQDLLDEYRARVQDTVLGGPPPGGVPEGVLQLAGTDRSAIVVDLPHSRLYVVAKRGGGLKLVASYYASIARNGFGKTVAGDLRTPVGIYHATGFEPGRMLPAMYGSGAFPLNYPNAWDRLRGRTGYGIWLHGVPATTYVRPPRTSEGCVVLANDDLLALRRWLVPGDTPVIFNDDVHWTAPSALAGERDELLRRIETWRRRWSSGDTDAYLGFYATGFRADGMNLAQFSRYKRTVNASKRHIDVRIRDLDLLRYPGEEGLVLAQFVQDYRSDDYAVVSRKQQFWRRGTDGQWRIVRELTQDLPRAQSVARN